MSKVVAAICLLCTNVVLATPASGARPDSTRFSHHGISFAYPSQWFTTMRPISYAGNPVYRFTVGNTSVRRTRADRGPCLPGIANQLRPKSVLAYLREALGADRTRSLPRMPRRPERFRLPPAGHRSLCGFRQGASSWIPFKQAGRAFYLGVYIGPRASPMSRRALQRLLNGMLIQPRPA